MYETPGSPLVPTEPAPGAKASFHLGLWSILLNALCGCFPVAIPLGIAAIVKHGKAESAAQAEPDRYAAPASTGKVLGIVGLCLTLFAFAWMGMVSAVAIPALLGQWEKARARAVQSRVVEAAGESMRVADDLLAKDGRRADPEQVVAEVLAEPQMQLPRAQNPYRPQAPAFRRGEEPAEDGEVTLAPAPAYHDERTGQVYPAVVVRGRYRTAGRSQTFEKVVPLD